MANILRTNRTSGSSKSYIFKDGVFSVAPTTNTWTLSNKKLVGTGQNRLVIPYVKTGEKVYIKYSVTASGDAGLVFSTTTTTVDYIVPNSLTMRHCGGITDAIVGLTSGTIIAFGKMNATATIAVSEIWTEKI